MPPMGPVEAAFACLCLFLMVYGACSLAVVIAKRLDRD
jgi:hypothetical protein